MIFAVITNQIGCTLTIFSHNFNLICLGFFLQGMFHLKTTVAFTYIGELMPENRKVLATTMLTAVDSSVLLWTNLCMVYITRDLDAII